MIKDSVENQNSESICGMTESPLVQCYIGSNNIKLLLHNARVNIFIYGRQAKYRKANRTSLKYIGLKNEDINRNTLF